MVTKVSVSDNFVTKEFSINYNTTRFIKQGVGRIQANITELWHSKSRCISIGGMLETLKRLLQLYRRKVKWTIVNIEKWRAVDYSGGTSDGETIGLCDKLQREI